MAKVFIEETTLTSIGDAIRGKEGTTELIPTTEMASRITAIQGGSDPVIESLEITSNGIYTAPEGVDGYSPIKVSVPLDSAPTDAELRLEYDCSNYFSCGGTSGTGPSKDWIMRLYGDRITTNRITNSSSMFFKSNVTSIPFELNYDENSTVALTSTFVNCRYLTSIPKINYAQPKTLERIFNGCESLVNLPDDITDWFNWSYIDNSTSSYGPSQAGMLGYCYTLRSIPMSFLSHGNPYSNYTLSYFYNGFTSCYSLDELVGLPIPYTKATWTSNAFYNTFNNCSKVKSITFALDPTTNAPYVVSWKSQTIDLSRYVGWAQNYKYPNSGTGKEMKDADTYEALKNDTDAWTNKYEYCRYNHDSAVATINSLPDTSAYLASSGGTNTIKFEGRCGSDTDGGAINTLTEEEIAVATAKGWTVTLV